MGTCADRRLAGNILTVDMKEFWMGIILVSVGFLMPFFFHVGNLGVTDALMESLTQIEKTELIEAALRMVLLNSIRAVPHYIGVFFIGESITFQRLHRYQYLITAMLTFIILRLTYLGIEALYQIHYDFGIPALLMFTWVLIFKKMSFLYISYLKKAVLTALFLVTFQFLDVMPALQRFPVGRGETSWDIKQAAIVLDGEAALNATCVVGILLFLSFAVSLLLQLREENTLKELNALKEQNQEIRMQAHITEIKNRTNQEMQYLVHDLKSPLTVIQTMVGVIKMEQELESRTKDKEYLMRIEKAVEQMSSMISAILYEKQMSRISTQTLVAIAMAQCSVSEYAAYIRVENHAPEEMVLANRILFPRVLVNLLQNSGQAVPKDRVPEIKLEVSKQDEAICFCVFDNGMGIHTNLQHSVWDRGVSGYGSSGLGLAFVHTIVTQMNGSIQMESEQGIGTRISILLPCEGVEDDSKNNHSVH